MSFTGHHNRDTSGISGHLGGVSVAVMAHPSRETFVSELLGQLDRPATVVWDEKSSRWDTGRRSMLAYDPEASHHLVIQDDAVPCRDLVAGVEEALAWIPPLAAMCLYIGRVRPWAARVTRLVEAAGAGGASWIVMKEINWGVGIVVPTATIPEMINFCDKRTADGEQYDRRLSRWFESQKLETFYPWPSLVDHRDAPSLVPGRTAKRHAHSFLGVDTSAVGLNWGRARIRVAPTDRPGERSRRRRQQMIDARKRSMSQK